MFFHSGQNRRCVVKSTCSSGTMCSTCGVFRIDSKHVERKYRKLRVLLKKYVEYLRRFHSQILTILPPILAILPPILTIALGLGISPGRVPNFSGWARNEKPFMNIEVFYEYLRAFYEYLRVVNPARMLARNGLEFWSRFSHLLEFRIKFEIRFPSRG